mgnify:FL=1
MVRGMVRGNRATGGEVIDRLFVYGTLREGHAAASMIADHVLASEPATTAGRIVAFTDGYPGMVEDSTTEVVGELLTISDLAPALALIDAYEGDDFARTIKPVQTSRGEVMAWCYLLASPAIAEGGTPIPHGDWLRFQRED